MSEDRNWGFTTDTMFTVEWVGLAPDPDGKLIVVGYHQGWGGAPHRYRFFFGEREWNGPERLHLWYGSMAVVTQTGIVGIASHAADEPNSLLVHTSAADGTHQQCTCKQQSERLTKPKPQATGLYATEVEPGWETPRVIHAFHILGLAVASLQEGQERLYALVRGDAGTRLIVVDPLTMEQQLTLPAEDALEVAPVYGPDGVARAIVLLYPDRVDVIGMDGVVLHQLPALSEAHWTAMGYCHRIIATDQQVVVVRVGDYTTITVDVWTATSQQQNTIDVSDHVDDRGAVLCEGVIYDGSIYIRLPTGVLIIGADGQHKFVVGQWKTLLAEAHGPLVVHVTWEGTYPNRRHTVTVSPLQVE